MIRVCTLASSLLMLFGSWAQGRPAGLHENYGSDLATSSSYEQPQPIKEAVVFTDAKLDDKMALYYLEQTGKYHHIHAIINGVKHPNAAHGSMVDFRNKIHQQTVNAGLSPINVPVTFYKGRNPLQTIAPHEHFYVGAPVTLQRGRNDLRLHPQTESVDVFHIGPTYSADIADAAKTIRNSGKRIDLLHTTAGYNSNQAPEGLSNGDAETQHIRNLYRKAPHGKTVMINTKTTFGGPKGGTQRYEWLKSRIPQDHLDPAGKDEWFHLAQLQAADEEIDKYEGEGQGPFPREDIPGSPDPQRMQKSIWRARLKGDAAGRLMSEHLVGIFEQRRTALQQLRHYDEGKISLLLGRLGAAISGFKEPCQAETCDANHIAAVLDAHSRHQDRLVPAFAESHRVIRAANPGEHSHGFTLLNQDHRYTRRLLENAFPPVFPSHADE